MPDVVRTVWNARIDAAERLERIASRIRGRRVRDVPAAREWLEASSDAADIRWAASLAQAHEASPRLVADITALADRVKSESNTARDVALRGRKP